MFDSAGPLFSSDVVNKMVTCASFLYYRTSFGLSDILIKVSLIVMYHNASLHFHLVSD